MLNILTQTRLSYDQKFVGETIPDKCTAQKMNFSVKDFFSRPNPQLPVDLATFNEEILHRKLHFLCFKNLVNLDGQKKFEQFGQKLLLLKYNFLKGYCALAMCSCLHPN